MALKRSWTGTALGLLNLLREIVDEGVTRSRDWPSGPEALSNQLRRAATFLRKAGVEVSFYREGKQGARMISIQKRGWATVRAVRTVSQPSRRQRFQCLIG